MISDGVIAMERAPRPIMVDVGSFGHFLLLGFFYTIPHISLLQSIPSINYIAIYPIYN